MKKILKLIVTFSFLAILVIGNPLSSFAATLDDNDLITQSSFIDLTNVEEQENVRIIDLTYDEMIAELAEAKGITIEEAKTRYPDRSTANSSNVSLLNSCITVAPSKVSITLDVAYNYKPTLDIYVWPCRSGSITYYQAIEEVDMNRESQWKSKQFTGSITAKLTTQTTIWWKVNGDFYDNGTTLISGTLSKDKLVWEGSGTISYQSDHFKYFNDSGVYSIY